MKSMKRLSGVLISIGIVSFMIACTNITDNKPVDSIETKIESDNTISSIEESSTVIIDPVNDATVIVEKIEEEKDDNEIINVDEPVEEDPWSYLRIEDISERPDLICFAIVKNNNKAYHLYDGGFDGTQNIKNGVLHITDMPPITYEPGDSIRFYSDYAVWDKVVLYRVEAVNGALPIWGYDEYYKYEKTDDEDGIFGYKRSDFKMNPQYISEFTIIDEDGNEFHDFSDIYNLTYGETYKLSWFEGTNFTETEMTAEWRVYHRASLTSTQDYEIEKILNKEGYAEYDFSILEPGLYIDDKGNVFDVK